MVRYKSQDRNSLLLPVALSEQIVPGSFAFALDYLVDNELDLTAMDAKFKNDEVCAITDRRELCRGPLRKLCITQ